MKVPVRKFKYFKNLTLLALFIILMQTIFGPGDTYIVKFGGIIALKWEGFLLGIVIICRLCALMILLPLFTETTPSNQIAGALSSLGINYRISFTVTSAFNFIPFFKEEANRIIEAQKLRGCSLFDTEQSAARGLSGSGAGFKQKRKKRSFFAIVKAYTNLLIPLILSAMRKAQSTSISMDSRAFGVYRTRTWVNKSKIRFKDIFVMITCLMVFIGLLILNYYFGL